MIDTNFVQIDQVQYLLLEMGVYKGRLSGNFWSKISKSGGVSPIPLVQLVFGAVRTSQSTSMQIFIKMTRAVGNVDFEQYVTFAAAMLFDTGC